MNQTHFIELVTDALKELTQNQSLRGWSLKSVASQSDQRLYASTDGKTLNCHQSRHVNGDAYQLSVYVPLEQAETIGSSTVDLVPSRPIDEQLAQAVELAKGSQNKAWSLARPPATPPAHVEMCDPAIRDNPKTVMADLENRFNAAFAATTDCKLNSAELFINYAHSQIKNSEGLDYSFEESDLYLEAALEKAGTENDKEVHEYCTSLTAADLDINQFVEECALQVAMLGDSEEPKTASHATILIAKDALAQMLQAICDQLNCAQEYLGSPFLQSGDSFGGGEGDALSIRLDPTLPCMALSSEYTLEGLPAQGAQLISNNTVKTRVIGNRFGQYLGLEPNGICGNLIVEPGTLSLDQLKGQAYIEVIKFSSLLIDPKKLTWSSEIKLGRAIEADGTVTLVKGGVVSGNLKENFTNCKLSNQRGKINAPPSSYTPALGYEGPDAMLITQGVSIAGTSTDEGGA